MRRCIMVADSYLKSTARQPRDGLLENSDVIETRKSKPDAFHYLEGSEYKEKLERENQFI